MILAIICAQNGAQARAFAKSELSIDDLGRFMRNAALVTEDERAGGANTCVLNIHSSVPFYVVGGDATERACAQTIAYLGAKGHPRGHVDEYWEESDAEDD